MCSSTCSSTFLSSSTDSEAGRNGFHDLRGNGMLLTPGLPSCTQPTGREGGMETARLAWMHQLYWNVSVSHMFVLGTHLEQFGA